MLQTNIMASHFKIFYFLSQTLHRWQVDTKAGFFSNRRLHSGNTSLIQTGKTKSLNGKGLQNGQTGTGIQNKFSTVITIFSTKKGRNYDQFLV